MKVFSAYHKAGISFLLHSLKFFVSIHHTRLIQLGLKYKEIIWMLEEIKTLTFLEFFDI